MNGRLAFLQQFLRHPAQIGSVIPSSRFLERRVIRAAGLESARTVVELGPGTGGTTRAILRALPRDARLLCIELNPRLHALTSQIRDPRLTVHLGSALELRQTLAKYGLPAPDVVISGIPFSTMDDAIGHGIVEAVVASLVPGGRWVAYQLSAQVASITRRFPMPERMELELLNVPPMRVYRWEKPGKPLNGKKAHA